MGGRKYKAFTRAARKVVGRGGSGEGGMVERKVSSSSAVCCRVRSHCGSKVETIRAYRRGSCVGGACMHVRRRKAGREGAKDQATKCECDHTRFFILFFFSLEKQQKPANSPRSWRDSEPSA